MLYCIMSYIINYIILRYMYKNNIEHVNLVPEMLFVLWLGSPGSLIVIILVSILNYIASKINFGKFWW